MSSYTLKIVQFSRAKKLYKMFVYIKNNNKSMNNYITNYKFKNFKLFLSYIEILSILYYAILWYASKFLIIYMHLNVFDVGSCYAEVAGQEPQK